MAHTVPTEFTQEKNKQCNKPTNLYTLYDYDGEDNNLYFAEAKSDMVFDGITYTAFPIMLDPISESTTGEIDSIRIKMGNAGRIIQVYIENYDLRGKKIGIKLVWADLLTDTDNYIEYLFYIDKYDFNAGAAVFTCSSKFDVLGVELPYGTYTRGVCRWIFSGTECAYSGDQTVCNKTMADCRIRDNIDRFGAFPSVPMQRTYLG